MLVERTFPWITIRLYNSKINSFDCTYTIHWPNTVIITTSCIYHRAGGQTYQHSLQEDVGCQSAFPRRPYQPACISGSLHGNTGLQVPIGRQKSVLQSIEGTSTVPHVPEIHAWHTVQVSKIYRYIVKQYYCFSISMIFWLSLLHLSITIYLLALNYLTKPICLLNFLLAL